jgi:hypothetical protein
MDDIEYQLTPKGKELSERLSQNNIERSELQSKIANPETRPTAEKLKAELKELDKKIAEAKKLEKEKKKQFKKVRRKKQVQQIEPGSRHEGYIEAEKIREQSMGSLIADQEGGLGASVGKAISSKFKAKMTGIKETFDPLNIAKFLTFGSDLGPALMGKMTGRTRGDMGHYMSDKPSVRNAANTNTATKIEPTEQSVGGMNDILIKILTLLKETNDSAIKQREEANNYAEENEREKQKKINDRHKELINALKGKFAKDTATNTDKDSVIPTVPGLSDLGLGDIAADAAKKTAAKTAIKTAEEQAAKNATEQAVKTTEKEIGKTATEQAVKTTEKEIGKTATKEISESSIKSTAKKILSNGALKTAAKSVPFAGLLLGLGFGVERAISGDWTGAAIETASGVAGPATSIGLGVVQASRDVHNALYGHYPDPTDPQDMENMKKISVIVKDAASELFKSETSDNKGASEISYDANGIPTGADVSSEPASSATTSSPTTSSKNKTPSATPTSSNSSSSAAPTSSPNSGQKLNSVVDENNAAKLPSNSTDSSPTINNQTNVATSKGSENISPIAAVRNMEDTFQRMIMNSTRVV